MCLLARHKKVSVKRNILFDGEFKPPKAPLVSTETDQLSTSRKIKKVQTSPSVTLVPIAHNVLNEESKIQRNIEIDSEDELEELQPGQIVPSGIKEVEHPRRSEIIRLQKEKMTSQGPVTISQDRKQLQDQTTSIAFEDLKK